MTDETSTADPGHPTSREQRAESEPVIRVLHHPDLRRVGDESRPPGFGAGQWIALGRKRPAFVSGDALLDPCISREVLQVRWVSERMGFEVEPADGQTLQFKALDGRYCPMGKPLPIGTVIEIRDRIMLLLTLAAPTTTERCGMVGESRAAWTLRGEIERIARSQPQIVRIFGATGTGKELVARALHEQARPGRPLVALNCASLSGMEGEDRLVGHLPGAFTDARRKRVGAFVEADGGTLFLDEIGELPLDMQARVLRVVQDRRVVPLGGSVERAVDVQLVVATHRDLQREVEAGRFRADLHGRLMGQVIEVPPLTARREDVPLLFRHFLARRAAAQQPCETLNRCFSPADRSAARVDIDFARQLLRHDWPLNVREVQRWAEWAVARLAAGQRIRRGDRPPTVGGGSRASGGESSTGDGSPGSGGAAPVVPPPRDALRAALRANRYEITGTGRALGVDRRVLYRWMRAYGLPTAAWLDRAMIDAAVERCGGCIERAANELEVSAQALRLRLSRGEGA